jgi:hypothetical protein
MLQKNALLMSQPRHSSCKAHHHTSTMHMPPHHAQCTGRFGTHVQKAQ